ncbi:MAG: PSD1 domain-containing protein [Planctomycetales bacterium]|nr:PSD1 domain-containing protein [Planctomycetales bacterium]
MSRRCSSSLLSLLCLLSLAAIATAEPPGYNADVKPILSRHCLGCHGFDESSRKGDLRLDTRQAAAESKAIVPGKPDESELIRRIISADSELRMPPADSGEQLSEAEIQTLRQWIAAGADYQQHWSFSPPRKAPLPEASRADWPLSPLDHFVFTAIEAHGLQPSESADRAQWLRRVSLDLTGLPPTFEEADRFLADESDQAYERVVDRLLESQAYGEHWARMWLDLARYADTKGYEKDRHRDIWRYRDWVIQALNRDMPFDQFTIEQLAGDLLPNPTTDQILATAFHRNTMTNEEGGTDNEEFRVAAVKDRVDTTIQVWMGLTMGCAKCHSHKYDPLSTRDYYSLYAIFNQTRDVDTETPFWPTPTDEQAAKIAELKDALAAADRQVSERPADFTEAYATWQKSFDANPLWQTLKLAQFESQHDASLQQNDAGNLIAGGTRPDKDTWTLTFALPAMPDGQSANALRIDYLPRSAGGEWPEDNVAIRELTVELVDDAGTATPLALTAPRATFSQRGWEAAKAIDGDTAAGWALAPKFREPQVAIFEFKAPPTKGVLRIKLEQQHGGGLLLARSRFSVSSHPTAWLEAKVEPNLESVFARHVFAPTKQLHIQREQLAKQLADAEAAVPQTPVMLELDKSKQRVTKMHNRGNFLDQGDEVTPRVPASFGQLPEGAPANRLSVARWLMAPENPLTARVMVNRVWARLFGKGLVLTEEDFGSQGMAPSHPELLDWLAVDFREQGWSLKQLLKTIVLSRTYRQTSVAIGPSRELDPENTWLSRGPRFRLSAESVRDQALAASGLLTEKIGGRSVMPPQPAGVWKSTYSGEDWKNAQDGDRYRRALYTYLKRTSPYPSMITFDSGSGEVCLIRRVRTNTPLQALVTLNDTAYVEAAGALARRMESAGDSLEEQLAAGLRLLLTRQPAPQEVKRLADLHAAMRTGLTEQDGAALLKAAGREGGDAAMVAVANVILNLDETLTKP